MNPAKYDDLDYINFLVASVDVFTCTEAARCQPVGESSSHDAFTRLLQRQPPDTDTLWNEVKDIVQPQKGFLVMDDTTLDKPYAKNMNLVYHFRDMLSRAKERDFDPEVQSVYVFRRTQVPVSD